MISGGKRWRRYRDSIGQLSPTAVNLTMPRAGTGEVHLEGRPPQQWDHFAGINDVRIAVELVESVSYFLLVGSCRLWDDAGP